MNEDIYKNYTTTSVLSGIDVDKFTTWSHLYFKSFILPHMPQNKACKILEIGCGYGRYTHLLIGELGFTNTVGIDISEEQIEYAKKKYGLHNVLKADAIEYLTNEKKGNDVVILMDVLEHLELDYAILLLTKIKESLNEGGKLIIQVPNGLSPLKPIFYGDVTHVRAFSANSMSQILRMAGFSIFQHKALPPLVHNFSSAIRRLIWTAIINPLVFTFVTLSHGNSAGKIYSSNLLTIAKK
jgi:2-polyprenyl-3-methyl-5-hydroxy-6-metoxy-1,4-benzoquinol methylase